MKFKLSLIFIVIICLAAVGAFSSLDKHALGAQEDAGTREASDNASVSALREVPTEVPVSEEDAELLKPMKLVSETPWLGLYVNEATGETAVRDKASGKIWLSNPRGRDQDPIAKGINKDLLSSQISIVYYDVESKQYTMNSYTDSAVYGQIETAEIPGGVRVIYTFGEVGAAKLVPPLILKERFEEIVAKLDLQETKDRYSELYGKELKVDRAKDRLTEKYRLLSLSQARDDAHRKELLDKYPVLEQNDLYEIRSVTERIVDELESYIKATGYTLDDLQQDLVASGYAEAEAAKANFIIPLEYKLENDTLVVRVPVDEIEYDHESFPIHKISLLDYFGAAGTEDEGYIFVPDGSGALISLNTLKNYSQAYVQPVYGFDNSLPRIEKVQNNELIYMPVFGLKNDDAAFFAIIEDGDAVAEIKASTSGQINSYNTVSTQFTTIARDFVSTGSLTYREGFSIFQPRMIDSDIQIRYTFLSGDKADYMGMAEYYQHYLVDKGILTRLKPKADIPFFLETIGSIDKVKQFLGMPREVREPLTTFDQAVEILGELSSAGIGNIKLRFDGWFNGGMNHSIPDNISIQGELGGVRGYKQLTEYIKQNNMEFYPEAGFLYIHQDKFLDSFRASDDAARLMNKQIASIARFNIATYLRYFRESNYILSPNRLLSVADGFARDFAKYGQDGIAFRYIGKDVNSDFRIGALVDRQQSMGINRQIVQDFAANGYKTMVNGGYAPVFKYTGNILNMPADSSHFLISDESVPFYQIVLHGFIEYAGEPINLAQDYTRNLLKSIETGSGVYYTWIYQQDYSVKDTDFNHLYSTHYENWIDKAVEHYNSVNSFLGRLQDQRIVDHEILAERVYRTTFEDGTEIIVNYNKHKTEVDGIVVEAEDYIVREGNSK